MSTDLFANNNDELLPGRAGTAHPDAGEGFLPGTKSLEEYLPGSSAVMPETQTENDAAGEPNVEEVLAQTTRSGGLTNAVPAAYRTGLWQTVLEAQNPFTILFLDYRQQSSITDEMVQRNYTILQQFWEEIIASSSDISRDRNQKKYGAATLENIETILEEAFSKISTAANRQAQYSQIESQRLAGGQSLLEEKIEDVIVFGELVEGNRKSILRKGTEAGLTEGESETYLYHRLGAAGFAPRPDFGGRWLDKRKHEELLQMRRAPQAQTQVNGTAVHTKEDIGEVLFYNRDWAVQNYLHNSAYLIGDISKLYNSDEARKAEAAFLLEKEVQHRYLRVVYNLNPHLPFSLDDQSFKWVVELLTATATNYTLFQKSAESFKEGHLQIWLSETDKEGFEIADRSGNTFLDFLTFVYTLNRDHPFYLNNEAFATPGTLIAKVKSSTAYRSKLSDAMERGEVFKWLSALGIHNALVQYNKQVDPFLDNPFYTSEERKKGAVQTLIEVLDEGTQKPLIKTSVSELSLLEIEGTEPKTYAIEYKVPAGGFVKARVQLATEIAGVTCAPDTLILESDFGVVNSSEILITIDPMQLQKGLVYESQIVIHTVYEKLQLPLSLRAIVPKKAYWITVVKYAVVFGIIFGFGRSLLNPYNVFPSYFIVLAVLVLIGVYGWRWIKKLEKIK